MIFVCVKTSIVSRKETLVTACSVLIRPHLENYFVLETTFQKELKKVLEIGPYENKKLGFQFGKEKIS